MVFNVLSVVNLKPKLSLWPITKDENKTRNQSELEANTCNQRQARETAACDHRHDWDWLRKWREFFEPFRERRKAKRKQKHVYFRHSIENRFIKVLDLGDM